MQVVSGMDSDNKREKMRKLIIWICVRLKSSKSRVILLKTSHEHLCVYEKLSKIMKMFYKSLTILSEYILQSFLYVYIEYFFWIFRKNYATKDKKVPTS